MTDLEAHLQNENMNLKQEQLILVAVLSKMFPSLIARHVADESGEDHDWGWVVYISFPTGQVSFHVGHDSRKTWFEHLDTAKVPVYDGHTSEMKWDRVVAFLNEGGE